MNKKKRIAIAHLWQEQNTFSPVLASFRDFASNGILIKDEIIKKFQNIKELGGFIKACIEEDVEIVPLVSAWDWPKGPLIAEDYLSIKQIILELIKESIPLDGILIAFHGAMVAQNSSDVEGDILESIRDSIEEDVPIALSLDLHANITRKMVDNSIYIQGYQTCPHIDLYETGYKTAKVFIDYINKRKKIYCSFLKLPIITPARLHNTKMEGPFQELFRELKKVQREKDIIGASIFAVQPWLDVEELGWSILVYAYGDSDLTKQMATRLGKIVWKKKNDFFVEETTPEDAIEQASLMKNGLMVISDSDSTLSGGTGDNTCILKALIEKNFQQKALLSMVDREVVKEAIVLGKGNTINCDIGGKLDKEYSVPIRIRGKILKILRGEFVIEQGHIGRTEVDMGKTIVLEINNIHVLVSEKMGPVYEQTVYKNAGLNPEDYRIVVVKSPVGFRDAYEPIAKKIVLANCPGITSSNLNLFKYNHIPRPIFPIDNIRDFEI